MYFSTSCWGVVPQQFLICKFIFVPMQVSFSSKCKFLFVPQFPIHFVNYHWRTKKRGIFFSKKTAESIYKKDDKRSHRHSLQDDSNDQGTIPCWHSTAHLSFQGFPPRSTLDKSPPKRGWITADGASTQHCVYWEEYGNPSGEVVLFIHGGPGGGTNPTLTGYFNPNRYRIILFDQRGCGKSTPHVSEEPLAALTDNTTQHLLNDILELRRELNILTKMHLFGGSWGSTLALIFAIEYPELVSSLILRGIFLVKRKDLDYFYQGNAELYHRDPLETKLAPTCFFPMPGRILLRLFHRRSEVIWSRRIRKYFVRCVEPKRNWRLKNKRR